jgi:hypothetical protein
MPIAKLESYWDRQELASHEAAETPDDGTTGRTKLATEWQWADGWQLL